MSEQFKKYSEENKKQAERDKEEEEKKHDDEVKDANQANSDTGNEIKDIADRPSAAYAALLQEGFTDGKVKASKGASIVSGLFSDFSGTVSQTAVDLRDDLYTLDYIMNMFSYDTFEKEGKYHLCGGGVNLSNYESNYNTQSEAWNNEAVTFSENKTLTNKMINSSNNYSYGNEVEYIIYGNSNEKNKKSAYGTIFAIRYALNLPSEFQENWNDGTLSGMAIAIESASSGIIPAPLFKLVVVLGLTAAETASDMQYLKNGMPVELVKNKDQLTWNYRTDKIQGIQRLLKKEKVEMRKKILVGLLIAVSVTCFSGCGSSSDQGNNTKEEVVTKKNADEKDENDLTFDYYELDDGTLEIQGYDNKDKVKIVEIPDTIDGKKVSVLNLGLFRSNEVVEEIILPESLKIIEDQAFLGATALRKLEINGIETMGDYCIYGCPKIKEVRLPEGLKELGESAIENCENLTDIYLPSTLETIDEYNFDLCADGLKIHAPAGSNTETLVRKVIENLEYNVEVVPE